MINFFQNKTYTTILIFILFYFFQIKSINAETITLTDKRCSEVQIGECTKGAPGETCPTCGTTASLCCSVANPYSKYLVNCVEDVRKVRVYDPVYGDRENSELVAIVTITLSSQSVCSTGDKYNSSEPSLLRMGFCDCSPGSTYKACCDNTTKQLVNASQANYDNIEPPEAGCPSGSSVIWNGGLAIDLNWAQITCNPCQNECLSPPSSGTCSGLDSTTYKYTNGTGLCASGKICCIKSAVVPTPTSTQPGCTMNSLCNDGDGCTSNICENPGTASAKCVYPSNGLCTTYNLYYCNSSSGTCSSTANTYTRNETGVAACSSSIGTSCYIENSDCETNCHPVITGTPSCVPHDCTTTDGACGSAINNIYTSSQTPSYADLCNSGDYSEPDNSYGYWSWTCYGSSEE